MVPEAIDFSVGFLIIIHFEDVIMCILISTYVYYVLEFMLTSETFVRARTSTFPCFLSEMSNLISRNPNILPLALYYEYRWI